MGLTKQPIAFNFSKGVSTKDDPWQIPIGSFLELNNEVFTTGGRLTKRFGYEPLPSLPELATFVTTFNENLTAIGQSLQALSSGTGAWENKGTLHPIELSTLPLIRSNTNQSQADSIVASNGTMCTVYTDQTPTNLSVLRGMYVIADSITGQNIKEPALIPIQTGTVVGSPRVFILGSYFIIVFTNLIGGVSHLRYFSVSISNPNIVNAALDIAASYEANPSVSWDAVIMNSSLYFAYPTISGGQAITLRYLASNFVLSSPQTYTNAGKVTATIMSVTADAGRNIVYASYYDSVSSEGYTVAVDANLNKIITVPAHIITGVAVSNLSTVAQNGVLTIYDEVVNNYGYDATIPTHYISTTSVTQAGTVGPISILARSVGLASKAFIVDGDYYFLGAYQSVFQPTYFLFNNLGEVIARLAYSNGGGYCTTGTPGVTVNGSVAQISYLIKDFITSQNTSTQTSITKSNIYSQTGINLVSFTIGTSHVVPSEIAQALHLSGGFLWEYDGYLPVEHNFFLWPDSVEGSPVNSGGAMVSQEYQYQVVYTWSDNQGNIHRSAPSIATTVDLSPGNPAFTPPIPLTPTGTFTSGSTTIVVSSATGLMVGQEISDTTTPASIQAFTFITKIVGTTITISLPTTASGTNDNLHISSINSVTLNIPTLRLTYKLINPVKLEIFRFSVAQQEFFQVTSIELPLINNTSVDYVTYTDTASDNQIQGNSLIYTTGGVVENIGAPSFNALTLFDDRLWGIDAEDTNLLWYSKQVIETTPVEMSDLFTVYVAPSIASQGSTGDMKCLAPMDDKLIIFKPDALYYINGTGPDNTGANLQYSSPLFITSVVGSVNQQSIVFMPDGLMFQSDKGIWLLGRGMGVSYIGAAVERYTTTGTVQSAVSVPGTTQVRFTLNTGFTLVYDYYYQQWGTFIDIPAISATLYQDEHTFINSFGQVFQEIPDQYLDGSNPVLLSFQTGWINVAGINGYQRIYELIFLGQFVSPANIVVNIAYDFGEPTQHTIISPTNYTGVFGSDSLFGQTSPFGGEGDVLLWRVPLERQKCQVFQITVQEQFDPSYGTIAGGGFTLSAITGVIGMKKQWRPIKSAHSVG